MELEWQLCGEVAFPSCWLQVVFDGSICNCVNGGDREEMFHSRPEKVGTLRHERELAWLTESHQEPIGVLGHTPSGEKV